MKSKIRSYVSTWRKQGYENGIPDFADTRLETLNKVPSYRMICKAIMKNDVALASLGFSRQPCDAYMALKKIEIEARK
jgi:predicted phosphoadenosine phosphosulfate sulfurtransferase